MFAKDYRALAWSKMSGKWGVCALITFIISLISGVIGALSGVTPALSIITIALSICVMLPFYYSESYIALSVSRGEKVEFDDAFVGFKIYGKALGLNFLIAIFTFLWSCLLIIPGIIKGLSYSMSNFILRDNPNMTAQEAITESRRMMAGNKWRLFCLCFSFIGWYLLSILTLGILLFWIQPYMNTSIAEFYRSLRNEDTPTTDTTETIEAEVVNE